MSVPTGIEKEAGEVVENARASLEACPCGCNREATAGLFAEMPDEELLFDVADLFKAFSDTTRIKILFALMGGGLSVGLAEALPVHCQDTEGQGLGQRAGVDAGQAAERDRIAENAASGSSRPMHKSSASSAAAMLSKSDMPGTVL